MRIKNSILIALLFQPFLLFAGPDMKIRFDNTQEIFDFMDVSSDQILYNLGTMDKKNLKSAKLDLTPWVGYYWPLSKGLLSFRYADAYISRNESWTYYRDNFKPAESYISRGEINKLSPAEKYDLLMGDNNYTLTKKMWDWGKIEMEKFSKIKPWAGISHGVALASLNLPEPKSPVKIWSIDRKRLITFSPDDIKALGSMMWSLGGEGARTLGERCQETIPQTDNTGRATNEKCFDLNPGNFHLAMVNQLGLAKKSFIIDSAYDEPVWNYPVVGYSIQYFNPNKPNEAGNLESSVISIYKYKNDPFASLRHPTAIYIVGIEATLTSAPNVVPWSATSANKIKLFSYKYDLELDRNLNIIGGEWYSKYTPDFIWQPAKGFEPKTIFEDDMNEVWAADKEYLPSDWFPHAKAASVYGIVLSPVVKNLFWLSYNGLNGYMAR